MRFLKTAIVGLLCWTVTGNAIRTIDGDSFVAQLEVWVQLYSVETIRVVGARMPEMKGPDRGAALAAKEFTDAWLKKGPFQVWACKRDAFGQLLGVVTREDSTLADELRKLFTEGGYGGRSRTSAPR